MWALSGIIFNIGEEVALDARRDDVSRRHLLEVQVIVRRHHGEGPLNAEVEGAPETLGHPTA